MKDCIFCKIGNGEIPSPKLFENDEFFCVRDIQPTAKTHLLVIPKQHVSGLDSVFENAPGLTEKLFKTSVEIARAQGLLPGGYRSVINTGKEGGQTVFHLHLHLMKD